MRQHQGSWPHKFVGIVTFQAQNDHSKIIHPLTRTGYEDKTQHMIKWSCPFWHQKSSVGKGLHKSTVLPLLFYYMKTCNFCDKNNLLLEAHSQMKHFTNEVAKLPDSWMIGGKLYKRHCKQVSSWGIRWAICKGMQLVIVCVVKHPCLKKKFLSQKPTK